MALVGAAAALGATKSAVLGEELLRERLSFEEPDFQPAEILASADEGAAIAASADGAEAILAVRVGDRIALRRFHIGQRRVTRRGELVIVSLGEAGLAEARVIAATAECAEKWRKRLSGESRAASPEAV